MNLFEHAAILERTTLEEKPTQCQQVLNLFIEQSGVITTGDMIGKLKVSQYNARIYQLRAAGWQIEKREHLASGSWIYRLIGREVGEVFTPFSAFPRNGTMPVWNS